MVKFDDGNGGVKTSQRQKVLHTHTKKYATGFSVKYDKRTIPY